MIARHEWCEQEQAVGLLNHNGQLHILVDRTIDVIDPRSSKWPNFNALATHLQIIDDWRAWLSGRVRLTILPGTI